MARYDLSGKTALVTGGARGIGFATAQQFVKRGANVAILDLHAEDVERSAQQIHDTMAMGIAADVTDRGAMQRAVAETVDRFGRLDVVVANAGIAHTAATVRASSTEALRAGPRRQPDGRLPDGRRRLAGDRPQRRARRRHRLDLRVHERRRRGVVCDGEGGRGAARARAQARAEAARGQRERRLLRLHRHRDGPPGDRRRPPRPHAHGHDPAAAAQAPAAVAGRRGDRAGHRTAQAAHHPPAPVGAPLRLPRASSTPSPTRRPSATRRCARRWQELDARADQEQKTTA